MWASRFVFSGNRRSQKWHTCFHSLRSWCTHSLCLWRSDEVLNAFGHFSHLKFDLYKHQTFKEDEFNKYTGMVDDHYLRQRYNFEVSDTCRQTYSERNKKNEINYQAKYMWDNWVDLVMTWNDLEERKRRNGCNNPNLVMPYSRWEKEVSNLQVTKQTDWPWRLWSIIRYTHW